MRLSRHEPGIFVSGAAHLGVLVAGLVLLASSTPLVPQEEALAVDLVSESELTAIAKGEKTAKEVKPDPKLRVDKVAEAKEEKPEGTDKRDVTVAASRPKELEEADKETAPPPQKQKAEPAKAPEKVAKVEPDKTPDKTEEKLPDPVKRLPQKVEEKPKQVDKKVEDKPKPVEKKTETKLDSKQLAKIIEDTKRDEKPKAKAAEPKEKSVLTDIRQLLENKEKPQSTGSKGQELNRSASLGSATGAAPKMSLSQRDALNGIVRSCIDREWSAPPPGASTFLLNLRMTLRPDGTLAANPEVASTSSDPAFGPWAASLKRAVLKCSPFKIPAQYDPFYADWRDWNILYDTKDFQG